MMSYHRDFSEEMSHQIAIVSKSYDCHNKELFGLFHSEHDAIIFFDYINSRHPNIRFTMEKEVHHKLPFLGVLIDNNDSNSLQTRVYRKKTCTGLLTNYFSFTSYSYKVSLIRTLAGRVYKAAFTRTRFHL